MKKYLFPLVMLSALLPCTAQDTVRWDDPWYLFNQKPLHSSMQYPALSCDGAFYLVDSNGAAYGARQFTTQKYFIEKNRPVYGIAITACFVNNDYPVIAYVYQQDDTGAMQLIDSVFQAPINKKDCFFAYEYYYSRHGLFHDFSDPFPS